MESPMPVAEADTLLDRLMLELGMRPAARSELMVGQAVLAMYKGDELGAWRILDGAQEIDRDLGRANLAAISNPCPAADSGRPPGRGPQ